MRIFVWLLRVAIFFTLFAFALNNQHETSVKWFFASEWRSPTVFVLLAAFILGVALGVLAMFPALWRCRQSTRKHQNTDLLQTMDTGVRSASTTRVPELPRADGF